MKKILSFISVFALLLTACEGDPGPPGPPGLNGLDGQDGLNADEYAAQSFERTIDFQLDSESGLLFANEVLPFDLLDSDVVLVYRLEEEVEIDGQLTEAWSALPQNFFLDGGDIIQYLFNHTFADVEFLIDGNFDLSTLGNEFTQDQRFRIVILPADPINGVDLSNLNEVMSAYNITEFQTF